MMKQKLNSILLIDDDEPTNFFYRIILEESACTNHIQIEQSGSSALDYIFAPGERQPSQPLPDLIILDINMPGMDGWDFIDKYRELQKDKNFKPVIIMLSTSLNPDDEIKANEIIEISRYMHKPLTKAMLCEIFRTYFREYL
jgi:CheY-like chemotaxis protein